MHGDHPASISHTRLKLNFSALNYHLFQKNFCPSPACALRDAPNCPSAQVLPNYCPIFAALREKLFASAAQLLGNRWHFASDKKKIDWFLNSISNADFLLVVSVCPIVYFFVKTFLPTCNACVFFVIVVVVVVVFLVCFSFCFVRS